MKSNKNHKNQIKGHISFEANECTSELDQRAAEMAFNRFMDQLEKLATSPREEDRICHVFFKVMGIAKLWKIHTRKGVYYFKAVPGINDVAFVSGFDPNEI